MILFNQGWLLVALPLSLVVAAFFLRRYHAGEVGLRIHARAIVGCLPGCGSYVGGDIVAGVMGSGMYLDERLTLFMDIGTNAEIVIGNRDWLACAACSAGPAFEGAQIEDGMRAAPGAICAVELSEGDLRVVIPEVTNTYGDRHSYLCFREDRAPINPICCTSVSVGPRQGFPGFALTSSAS